MARTAINSKEKLIKSANEQFDKLWDMIGKLSEEMQEKDFCFDFDKLNNAGHWSRDKNLRDVLVHLVEWHYITLAWEKVNTIQTKTPLLMEPFTGKNYGKMVAVWEKYNKNQPNELFLSSHTYGRTIRK